MLGYGCDEFPAFYLRTSGEPAPARVDIPAAAAAVARAHWELGGGGVVVAQPVAAEVAVDPAEWQRALAEAERDAARQGVRGPAVTPFLLARLAEITEGRTLRANQALVVANAGLAAQIAALV